MRVRDFVVAASLVGLVAASSAFAADIPAKVQSPAPMAVNWTGAYGGFNAGYGWATVSNNTATNNLDGFVGGGQFGNNWQMGALVLGLEGDLQYANQRFSTASSVGVTALATARGRIGYAHGPWLVYGTGGIGWVNYRTSPNTVKLAYTGGGGIEWMFTPGWSVKVEYLYLDAGTAPRVTDNIVRAGLNIHFH